MSKPTPAGSVVLKQHKDWDYYLVCGEKVYLILKSEWAIHSFRADAKMILKGECLPYYMRVRAVPEPSVPIAVFTSTPPDTGLVVYRTNIVDPLRTYLLD